MSTKYLRLTTRVELSRSSDYTSPIEDFTFTDAATPAKAQVQEFSAALAPGTTIDLSPFSTVTDCLIRNRDTTNYVDVTFRTTPGAATDQKVRVLAGKTVSLGSAITVASDLVCVANVGACECVIAVFGT